MELSLVRVAVDRVALLLACLTALSACALPVSPRAVDGVIDLRGHDWAKGAVTLAGTWNFGDGVRSVPDTWSDDVAGGIDGRGSGTYRLKVLLDSALPPLALRYGTASTAFSLKQDDTELVRVGVPSADPSSATSAFAPGTVHLKPSSVVELSVFVSNHDYRVGGLWMAPQLGPASMVERDQWRDETAALCLASALSVIGLSSLMLFVYRRTQKAFLHLGLFALLIGLRSLVTGEYPLVKLMPDLPFDFLIRLEYLTAFLPLPTGVLFFREVMPGLFPNWLTRAATWPSWAFALLALALPLDLLTRALPWFYPLAIPALVIPTGLLVRRVLKERQHLLLLAGVAAVTFTGLADMLSAALLSTTGTLVPWGLGLFVVLQATTLAQSFLAAFSATEALLAQKELLVKEVHHRVKNSLQVVASLVSLQSNRTKDPAQKAVFQALRQRITAIALVHEKLYLQGAERRPEVGEYLTDLLKLQYPGDGLSSPGMSWEVHADPVVAGVDFCIDAGLILTELVANAHKHAFSPGGGGKLDIAIRVHENRLAIEVSDDGPGFPDGFNPESGAGLGFRLVSALLQRNDGKLIIGPAGRVVVDLRLPTAAD